MLSKFTKREDQRSLSEALVYLKLREHQCDSKKSLVFAKKYINDKKKRKMYRWYNKNGWSFRV